MIIVKIKIKWHAPGESIEGISYNSSSIEGKKTIIEHGDDILGYEITEHEKADKIPDEYVRVEDKVAQDFNCLYTAVGVNRVYSNISNTDDSKFFVESESFYLKKDEKGESNDEYRMFDEDSYSKFCYLFKKENRMFCLTY